MSEIVAKSEYDVVIIGAGISGMTSAALLSRAGLSVCVVEKEPHAGGYLAGFRRKDFRFDSAIHWLNQYGKRGIVTKVFQVIGSDRPKVKTLEKIYRTKTAGHDYLLTNNPDELKAKLIADFPHEKKGIEKLFKVAKKAAESFYKYADIFRTKDTMTLGDKMASAMKSLAFIRPIFRYIWYNGEEGMTKGLNLFFKDPKLHAIWASEKDLLSCIIPIAWAYNKDYQVPPEGGSQRFIEWLVHVVEYYNNDIVYNATVEKILVDGDICKGVILEKNGQQHQVKSQHVIAACDVEHLYEKMLPPTLIPQTMKDNLKGAVLYSSALAISLGLDCPTEELGFDEELILILEEGLRRDEHDCGDPYKTSISIIPPSLRDKSMAPEGNGTLTIYTSANIDYKNNWGTERDEKGGYIRTDAYYKIKQEFADIIIERIEKHLKVDLRSHMLFCDVASPVTHWRYTNNRDGSIMGARPGRKNMEAKVAHHQTPVKNLLLSGHWSELGGGVPIATRAAMNTAIIVLHQQKSPAFKPLAKYVDGKLTHEDVLKNEAWLDYDNSWVQAPTPAEQRAAKKS